MIITTTIRIRKRYINNLLPAAAVGTRVCMPARGQAEQSLPRATVVISYF